MLAFLYLCLAVIFGISLIVVCVDTNKLYMSIGGEEFSKKIPRVLFIIPAGITIGIMLVTFVNYYIIFLLDKIRDNNDVNFPLGITLTFLIFTGLTIFNIFKLKKKEIEKIKYEKKDIIFFSVVCFILVLAVGFLMFYTCRIEDNNLLLGYSTFSDFAVHTAMTSSFGVGGNIPTSFMHFPGDGIHWHFFFYFFAGILNYLGFPLDFALNIPSILVMVGALVLLGLISSLLAKNKIAFWIAPILVLFRSSFNIFFVVQNFIDNNISVIDGLLNNISWSNVTPYDSWGLWAINVYANQRHLMLGVSVLLVLVILFIPLVKEMLKALKEYGLKEKLKYFTISKDAWRFFDEDKRVLIASLFVVTFPYFHGSALITSLLVLCVFAIFSKNRLSYLLIAILAIISSVIQTNLFSGGAENVAPIKFQYGFVLGNVPILELLKYILIISGTITIISLIYVMTSKENRLFNAVLLLSFIVPAIFACLFKVTVEMTANHKFIQFSMILIYILVACCVSEILSNKIKIRKFIRIPIGIILLAVLTSTGLSEWLVYININKNSVSINTKSELVSWIKENTEKTDVFLTPTWAANRFFLSGRAAFYGHSYYAWSAGHDTGKRSKEYEKLVRGWNEDKIAFVEFCKENNIRYIIDDREFFDLKDEMTGEKIYNQEFVRENFEMIAEFEEEHTRIYRVY